MHIAVVVPAFNVADFLGDTIRSIIGQDHRNWSMVVVDDGSTDATATVAAGFDDPRILVVRQPNAGVSAARNAAIAVSLARAPAPEAVLFLDGDDWLAPNALRVLDDTLAASPKAVAAVGRFVWVGPDGVHRPGPRPPAGNILQRLLTHNLFPNGGHLLIRRAAVEATGAFRTDLTYGEDWEYWTRLALLGQFATAPCPAPLFVRERLAGAYLSHATDPSAYRPALEAIYCNPVLTDRLGAERLATLAHRAEAEMAWTVGRELVRHGRRKDGLIWLKRSIRAAPSPKRAALLGLASCAMGPFRPYPVVLATTKQ